MDPASQPVLIGGVLVVLVLLLAAAGMLLVAVAAFMMFRGRSAAPAPAPAPPPRPVPAVSAPGRPVPGQVDPAAARSGFAAPPPPPQFVRPGHFPEEDEAKTEMMSRDKMSAFFDDDEAADGATEIFTKNAQKGVLSEFDYDDGTPIPPTRR